MANAASASASRTVHFFLSLTVSDCVPVSMCSPFHSCLRGQTVIAAESTADLTRVLD